MTVLRSVARERVSGRLLQAAVSGLVVVASGGCGDDDSANTSTTPVPNPCVNCHGVHEKDKIDASKFTVYVFDGSTRTTQTWLDRAPAEQERIVAFGAHGTLADGTAYENMSPYHRVLSRPDIERVVKYVRTLQPVMWTIKVKDK